VGVCEGCPDTFTGSLRAVDEERWEVLYRANNDLYKSHVFPNGDSLNTTSCGLRMPWKRPVGLPLRRMGANDGQQRNPALG
jgi:hypothetical protein